MLLIKQNKKKSKGLKRIWVKLWLKKRNNREVHMLTYFQTNWQILALSSNEFHIILLIIHWFSYFDVLILLTLYLWSKHWLLHHRLTFTIHCSTRFSFLQIASSSISRELKQSNQWHVWHFLLNKYFTERNVFLLKVKNCFMRA